MKFLKRVSFIYFATETVYGAGAQIATNISDIDTLEAEPAVEVDDAGDTAAPNVLTTAENRAVLCNEGTLSEQNYHTLPAAEADLEFTFICNDTDGIRITADTGDTIRMGGSITVAGGYIVSVIVGSTVKLICIDATEWIAVAFAGTWDVETT